MARIWKTKILRESKLTDQEHRQLELLYQNVTSQLEAAKNRQWQVLVFYSAVAAFLISQVDKMSEMTRGVAAIGVIAGAFPTGVMIWLLQGKIKTERWTLERIYLGFSDKFNFCRNPKGPVGELSLFEKWFCGGSIIYLIVTVVVSAMILKIGPFLTSLCRILSAQ